MEPAGQLKRKTWGEAASMQQGLDTWLWQLITEMLAIFVLTENSSLHFLHTPPDFNAMQVTDHAHARGACVPAPPLMIIR